MKLLVNWLVLLGSVLLSGCITKPPNILVCRDLQERPIWTKDDLGMEIIHYNANPVCTKELAESSCGFCIRIISNEVQYIGNKPEHNSNKKSWNDIKSSAVLIPTDSYAELKAYVINSCKKNKDCQDDVDSWRLKLEKLEMK